jgi:cysteine-rich repeat protein
MPPPSLPVFLHPLLLFTLILFPTCTTPQAIWFDQRYTAPYPDSANRLDGEIETATTFGLGVYRRPAEATSVGAAAAARHESDRNIAAPTLFEVTGGSLHGRTIDGLPINGKQIRNNTDLSSSSFRSTSHSLHLSGAGRLNATVPWIPRQQTPYEFVQVSFPTATLISHVSTRGGGSYGGWVTKFKLATSMDGSSWNWYMLLDGEPKTFSANTDINTIVRHSLYGAFAIQSLFAPKGKTALSKQAPLLARMLRLYPLEWNTTLALRFDILRRVECGDGVWDEMNEQCEDGNVISGDGCSGTSGNWRGTDGPCKPEIFTTEYYKGPQKYLDGKDSGHTVAQERVPPHPRRLSQWCHPGSDCYDCASQRVSKLPLKYSTSTQEHYLDPTFKQHCQGRRSRAEINGAVSPDRPPVPDDGYVYRTTESIAKGEVLYPNAPHYPGYSRL